MKKLGNINYIFKLNKGMGCKKSPGHKKAIIIRIVGSWCLPKRVNLVKNLILFDFFFFEAFLLRTNFAARRTHVRLRVT